MSQELVCITCPMGCRLTVGKLDDGGLSVSGNRCPRGVAYAEAELLDPRRTVTATCGVSSADAPRLPVRTTAAFPRERVPELLAAIYAVRIRLPVRRGTVILADALGTGIDVIATRSLG
ncbi:MAG: DUF1667 domain-containing protein [Spirochaetes bacterium]|nr:DUF1667 domain-containing protein [Spirochaetota bacterium]